MKLMQLAGSYITDDKYQRLVALAEQNNITMAHLCRKAFDAILESPRLIMAPAPPKPPTA